MSLKIKEPKIREKVKFTPALWVTQFVMLATSVLFLAPLLIILNYSFKTKKELYVGNPLALPQSLNLTNYENAYKKLNLEVTFFNTAIYTVISVLILALLCGAAAWAIARNKGKFFQFAYLYFIVGINTGSLKVYDLLVAYTNGGPGRASTSIIYYTYSTAINGRQYGYGSALTISVVFALLLVAFLQVKVLKKREVQM